MTTKIKNPKLRFKEFSGEWKKIFFSSVYDFVSSNSYSRDNLNYISGEIKNIHYGDIHTKYKTNFDIIRENVPYINSEIDLSNIDNEKYCKEGDLILADASEDYKDIGKAIEIINLDNQKVLAGLHTFIARPKKNKVSLGFGGYLMKTFNTRLQIMIYATGTKVLGISKYNLGLVNIYLPELTEQEKIVIFLDKIDEKINNIKEKSVNLENYKKGIIQKIFKQEIKFKDEKGNNFGEWKPKTLNKVFKERKEYSSKGLEFPHISLTTQGVVPKSERYERDFLVMGEDKQYKITRLGDICYNPANLKFGVIAKNNLGDGIFSPIYVTFEVIGENDVNFIEYFVTRKDFINRARKYEEGTVYERMAVKPSDFLRLEVELPTLPEQKKIAEFLRSIDYKINSTKDELEQLENFKKGLLQNMFI